MCSLIKSAKMPDEERNRQSTGNAFSSKKHQVNAAQDTRKSKINLFLILKQKHFLI